MSDQSSVSRDFWRRFIVLLVIAQSLCPAISVLSFAQAPPSTVTQLDRAARFVDAQQWQSAEKTLRELLQRTPNQPDALNLLGIVSAKQGQADNAEKYFRAALRANPSLAAAWLNLAKLYEERGDADRALQTLEDAGKRAPHEPRLLAEAADLLAAKENYTEAARLLETIPAQARTSDQWEMLGRVYLSAGSLPKAEESLRQVLSAKPDWVPILRQLAGIALKEGEDRRAGEYMQRAVRVAPNSPDLLYEYAQVCLHNGFSGEAVRSMRRALLLDSNRPEFLYLLGQALMDTPDYHDALPYFKEYVEKRPDDANGEASLGWSLYLEQKFDESKHHFEKAVEMNPNQEDAWYHLGMIAFESGDRERAIEILDRSVQLAPRDARPHLGLGLLYVRSEDTYSVARKELETAAGLDPEEPKTHYQLSQLYTRLGEAELAQKELSVYKTATAKLAKRTELSLQPPLFSSPEAPKK